MEIRFVNRAAFTVCGYSVETCLADCAKDLDLLWQKKDALPGLEHGFYGVMWYTENHRYVYLVGTRAEEPLSQQDEMECRHIAGAKFAVAIVPQELTVVEAWTQYFETELPGLGYMPDAEHGSYFEFYPNPDESICELWTPVKPL